MDHQLVRCIKEKKIEDAVQLLEDTSNDTLKKLVDDRALRNKGDPSMFIRAVFAGSPVETDSGVKRRRCIFTHCIQLLKSNELNSTAASELVGLLMSEVDNLPGQIQAKLAMIYVDAIKSRENTNTKFLELFPKLLSALEGQEWVQQGNNSMKGAEYKSHVLNTICSNKWNPSSVIHLAAMLKDVSMTDDELKFVMDRIVRMFKDLEVEELPPLVYQLLLLSTKGHKIWVLENVTRFFTKQDKLYEAREENTNSDMDTLDPHGPVEQLRQVEGTIILHINFVINNDRDLGKQFIKYLKSGQPTLVLAPFTAALALSVARINKFEEQIFDYIKSAIVKSYKDCERKQDSQWVREMAPENFSVETLILQTVYNSKHGWDQVTQGLVELGFILMDAFGPKAAFGRILEVTPTANPSPTQRACNLGAQILLETFKAHDMVRSDILEQILNRVVTKATQPVTHFLDLLSKTVMSCPQLLLDSLPRVREAFDYLSFLPPTTAESLLRAVQPLMKVSMSLRDALILVLRKSMFSKQVEARRIAVSGFLMILRNFKILGGITSSQGSQSMSFSQVAVDIHIPYNPSNNEALCLEILGNLGRAFTQQPDVRIQLYQGLFEVLCKNSQLAGPILDLLFTQFKKYYEANEDVVPPIKLEHCSVTQGETPTVIEPLAHLVNCLIQCLLKMLSRDNNDDEEGDDDNLSELRKNMNTLSKRMLQSEMEDFELDKCADFSLGTSVGVKNSISALIVSGIYEGLFEYNFTLSKFKKEECEELLQLYLRYQKLVDLMKEKTATGGGKKGGKGVSLSVISTKSHLSIKFVSHLVKSLVSDVDPQNQEGLTILRDNLDLMKYSMSMAIHKLGQVRDKGHCDGAEGHNKDKLFKYTCSMARAMLKHYTADLQSPDENKRDRKKGVAMLALEGFAMACSVAVIQYKDMLIDFLCAIDKLLCSIMQSPDSSRESGVGLNREDTLPDLVHKHIKKFQRMVISIITSNDDDRSIKEAISLLNVIGQLCNELPSEGQQFIQVLEWVQRLCKEQRISDIGACKVLLNLLFKLTSQHKSCAPLLRELACDIHNTTGDINEEVTVEDSTDYSVVNQRTATPTVLLLLLAHADTELEHTEWIINKVKIDATLQDTDVNITQKEAQEKSIMNRLGHKVNMYHELVQSALPVGLCLETMVKSLIKMYGVLTLVVKYYLGLYQLGTGHMSPRFEKLVKLTATNLTQHIYAMITYMQASQQESMQQAAEKNKKDKKKQDASVQVGRAIMKEAKLVPALIYALEQFEQHLIKLTNKSKVNLMDNFKMSTNRDFRINRQALDREESSESESSEEEENQEGSDNDENEPQNKKARTTSPPPKKGKNVKSSQRKLSVKNS